MKYGRNKKLSSKITFIRMGVNIFIIFLGYRNMTKRVLNFPGYPIYSGIHFSKIVLNMRMRM